MGYIWQTQIREHLIRTQTNIYIHIYIYIHARIYINLPLSVYIFIYICMFTCMLYICTYISIDIICCFCHHMMPLDDANGIQVVERAESFRAQQSKGSFVLQMMRYSCFPLRKDSSKKPSDPPGLPGTSIGIPRAFLGRPQADRWRPWGRCFCHRQLFRVD